MSCDERKMSSACASGESSSANAAWMPPCAFAELFACSEPFVASATRSAGALGGNRCGEARGPAPDHEHVKEVRGGHSAIVPNLTD